jgi:protoporphyrinogen oxidase
MILRAVKHPEDHHCEGRAMSGAIVLGAGLAGLSCARNLPGCRVFDAAAQPGGQARSVEMGGVWFDRGLHIADAADELADAVETVKFTPLVRGRWQGRWLTEPIHDHLRELPLELGIRALSDLVEAHAQLRENGLFGQTLTEIFRDELSAKYWRTALGEAIPHHWARPELPRVVRGAFLAGNDRCAPVCYYPLVGGFAGALKSLGDGIDVQCGERAVEIDAVRRQIRLESGRQEAYRALVSSIPLRNLIEMIRDVPAEFRTLARSLRWTQLLCVNLIVDRPRLTDSHWFWIYDRAIEAARVSLPGNLAPGSVPEGRTALQAEVYRREDEPLDINAVVEQTIADLGAVFGFSRWEIRHLGHIHVRHAEVIPDHNHALAPLLAWLEARSIHAIGGFGRWQPLTIGQTWVQGREMGQSIAARSERRMAA